jgi:DNA-binding beta-propeller fold protein YncE
VISINTDTVVDTIEVGDNPNSIVAEADGTLWVSSSGALAYNDDWTIDEANSSKGSISKIESDEEVLRLPVDKLTINGPANLTLSTDRNTLYFRFDAKVFSMPVTGTSLPSEPFKEKAYYGLSVDPISGHILGFSAPNFSTGGYMEMLDESGDLIDSYLVGIAPNGCAFK